MLRSERVPRVQIQGHFTWIFAPSHRWYLYFFEKVVGKIASNDTIALPFWNYDANEDGMKMLEMYKDVNSSLYNPNRNNYHGDQTINLNYTFDVEDLPVGPTMVQDNLAVMAAMYSNESLGYTPLFMGDKVVADNMVSGATTGTSMGRLERNHNLVHTWVGQAKPPNIDMGGLHIVAKDTLFWAHHANIDQLWSLYHSKQNNALEFNDSEWLDSTIIFYDENQKIITVSDTFDTEAMGYTYEDALVTYMTMSHCQPKITPTGPISTFGSSPRRLDRKIKVVVSRPKASRSGEDKANKFF